MPSQSQGEAGEDVAGVVDLTLEDDDIDTICVQGANAYHNVMPMYKDICKMVNASGHNGSSCWKIILKGMNIIRRKCYGATTEPSKSST